MRSNLVSGCRKGILTPMSDITSKTCKKRGGRSRQIYTVRAIREMMEGLESMQITDVRVRRIEKEGKMKAIVSITLDNEFVIHDIKVIEGEKGLFIAMPSRKAADGEYRDIAHPINSATRDLIQGVILDKYKNTLMEHAEESQAV